MMKNPKILYILIIVFCIFAIIAGIYAQIIDNNKEVNNENSQEEQNVIVEKSQEEIKDQFEQLFTNTLQLGSFDTTGIPKINNDNEIVYSIYDREEVTDYYELNIHIPVINIRSDLSNTLNQITQATFINKANEILQSNLSVQEKILGIIISMRPNTEELKIQEAINIPENIVMHQKINKKIK